jgi:hypothetical protein
METLGEAPWWIEVICRNVQWQDTTKSLAKQLRSLSLSKQIKKFERKKKKKKSWTPLFSPSCRQKKKNSKEKKFWTPFTPSCRLAEVQTHSFFHFTPKVFPLTKELLPPSITSACRPPRSSSRRPPATPPPADKSDACHLHRQQPSTTVLNGPNAPPTTHHLEG